MQAVALTDMAIDLIDNLGKSVLEEVSQTMIQSEYSESVISDALTYYAQVTLPRVLPIFPALIYLSCKAVGGKPENTKKIAIPMMLITASGDIHDDIIDKSKSKFRKKTVFGKYGKDITLLVGDTLLTKGMALLQKNCEYLQPTQRIEILDFISKAMFELVEAEASETRLWKKENVTPTEYFEVIRKKGSVAELHCRIGGILGDADEVALEHITRYGRAIGLLSTMKDEFMDLQNLSEIRQRISNEMLPYPFIYAFQNETLRKLILPIISKSYVSKKELAFAVEMVINSVNIKELRAELKGIGQKELAENPLLQDSKKGNGAALLLQALANEV